MTETLLSYVKRASELSCLYIRACDNVVAQLNAGGPVTCNSDRRCTGHVDGAYDAPFALQMHTRPLPVTRATV